MCQSYLPVLDFPAYKLDHTAHRDYCKEKQNKEVYKQQVKLACLPFKNKKKLTGLWSRRESDREIRCVTLIVYLHQHEHLKKIVLTTQA